MSDYIPEEKKRAGNTDRDRYIDHLATAVSTGHISEEEFSERRDKALAAITKGELQALAGDLPGLPERKRSTHMVTYQVGGSWHFSPVRWGAALVLSAAMLVLPGPLFAAAFGGFNHAPLEGALPVLLILAGVATLLGLGIAWAPCDKQTEVYDDE